VPAKRRPLYDPGLRTILQDLRRSILNGRLRPGVPLPAVRELASRYGVTGTTIHRCLQELAAAGFIVTHARSGTRVVDHPPHRHRYGLVLPELPNDDGAYPSRHWEAKAISARLLNSGPERTIEIFHGLNGHPELPEHQVLLTALAQQRLAGLILVDEGCVSEWLKPSRLGVPVVGVAEVAGKLAIGDLRLDLGQYLVGALTAVAKRGRCRPAVLLNHQARFCLPTLRAAARRLGLALPLQRIQCLPTLAPDWAAHVIAGLFAVDSADQPDALILCDEGVIQATELALDTQGIGEIFQVHIANLPLPALGRRHALHLGWNHVDYLRSAMERIDAWHQRREPIGNTALPLVDGSDITPTAGRVGGAVTWRTTRLQ